MHGPPIDVERLARGTGLRRVAWGVAPTDVDLLEAEVVRDFFPLRMEHVAVAVPHLLVLQSLALLDDLFESRQRGREIDDGDDPAAAAVVQLVGHLASRVAGEENLLAELAGESSSATSIAS